jgi:hypothetical protein
VIFSHVDICSRNKRSCTRKEREACNIGLVRNTKRSRKEKCWTRDRESCTFEFKGVPDIEVQSASTSSEFLSVLSFSFCLCLRPPFTPGYPSGSDTVATSGFSRLPLCFTCVRWTARIRRSWTSHCIEIDCEAMTSTYRLF